MEDANSEQTSLDGLEGEEQEPQPMESFEPERKIKNSKYNLRKSLAWDNAFFTSAGMLSFHVHLKYLEFRNSLLDMMQMQFFGLETVFLCNQVFWNRRSCLA